MTLEEGSTRTAYQESGHAVIAYLLGEKDRLAGITIKPDVISNAAGSVFLHPPFLLETEDEAHCVIRIFLAGLHAKYLDRQTHDARSKEHENSEAAFARTQSVLETMERALSRLELSVQDQQPILYSHNEWVMQRIREPENWYAIEKLTEALLVREALTGDEARTIIKEALSSPQR